MLNLKSCNRNVGLLLMFMTLVFRLFSSSSSSVIMGVCKASLYPHHNYSYRIEIIYNVIT